MFRARRRKKLAKALDRQARKLRAKGIAVDLEALRQEYIAQHRNAGTVSDSDPDNDSEECMIDVVGGDSDDESGPEDFSIRSRLRAENLNSSHNSDSSTSDVQSTRNFSPSPGKMHPSATAIFNNTFAVAAAASARFDFGLQRGVSLDLTAGSAMGSSDSKNSGNRKHNPFSIESLLNT